MNSSAVLAMSNNHEDIKDKQSNSSDEEWSDAVDKLASEARRSTITGTVRTTEPLGEPEDKVARLVETCKTFWLALISNFLLLFIVAVYSVAGGFLFHFLEWRKPTLPKDHLYYLKQTRMMTALKLMGVTKISSNFSAQSGQHWIQSVEQLLGEFEMVVIEETARHFKEEGVQWTFMSSIVYSVTLITSIGYGNLTPNTVEGRIATMFYSMVGIPLALLYLTSIGAVMADLFKFSYNRFAAYWWRVRTKKFGDPSIRVPVAVTLTFLVFYNALGVLIFSVWENKWTPVISAYFCFITLSTIGLGDFVFGFDEYQQDPWKQLVGALYLVLGLSVMSMGFSLLKDEIIAKYRWVVWSLTKIKREKKPKEHDPESDTLSEIF